MASHRQEIPAIATADRSASLSKNPGNWDPSSQIGVLLHCVSFYPERDRVSIVILLVIVIIIMSECSW